MNEQKILNKNKLVVRNQTDETNFVQRVERLRQIVRKAKPETVGIIDNWKDGFHDGSGPNG